MYTKTMFKRIRGFIPYQPASSEATTWTNITSTHLDLNSTFIGVNFMCTIIPNSTAMETTDNEGVYINTSTTLIPSSSCAVFLPIGQSMDFEVENALAVAGATTDTRFSGVIWNFS